MAFPAIVYGESDKKAILVVINEVNIDDLYSIPTINGLIKNGAIGLMNTRTSTRANTYKAYATIGAGTRAEATSDSLSFTVIDHEALEIYNRRSGLTLLQNGIVNINIAKLWKQNETGEYGAIPGSLGQSLQRIGVKTAVISNSDTDETRIRLGPAIAMDHNGYINYGEIDDNILEKDPSYPFGIKSNYKNILDSFKNYYEKSDFIVVDLGDVSRLERYKDNLTHEQYINLKLKTLNDINLFTEALLNSIDLNNSRIFMFSPYPSSKDITSGRNLSPVLVYGEGVSSGLLYSDTTRRAGIVGNIDIAPSILQYFDTDSPYIQGKVFNFVRFNDNYNFLVSLEEQVVKTSNYRYPVLSSFASFEILISVLSLTILLFREKFKPGVIIFITIVLLCTMIIPLVLLIIPLFKVTNLVHIFFIIILAVLLFSILARKFLKELDAIIFISGLTTIFILIDLVFNANLMKASLLGYDPIIGARYYGLGNEYMGVLIGSTIVFTTALLDRYQVNRKSSLFIFFVTIFIIGLPKFGANVGGTITAVSAFSFTALRLYKVKISLKQIIFIGLMVFAVVFIMAFVDLKLIKSQSHLAGAIKGIIEGGPSVVLLILKRKISMNLRLIRVTIWSKVLITTIGILGILLYRPVKMIKKLVACYPNITIGWTGIVVGCVVTFAVNDSGIVAAATSIIFLATSLLYLGLLMPED